MVNSPSLVSAGGGTVTLSVPAAPAGTGPAGASFPDSVSVPEEAWDGENTRSRTYHIRVSDVDGSDWYVTCFLMTWIPEDNFTVVDEEVSP